MALITENAAPVFDLDQVRKGDLIRAKHETWNEYRNGVVISASEKELVAHYYAGYGNVSNHFVIFASEVEAGEWSVKWTTDMETINDTDIDQGEDDGIDGN